MTHERSIHSIPLEPLASPVHAPTPDEAPAEEHRTSRRWPAALLLILLALVGWETGATIYQHARAPVTADWRAAATKLQAERAEGEPIIFAPHWIEPLGRLHFGRMLDLEQLLRSDVDRFPRVWQVSVRGAKHEWLGALEPTQRWRFNAVTVALYEKEAARVLYDFSQNIKQARVERVGAKLTRCTWQGDRFLCDKRQRWNWVGPRLAEVAHRPYRCIYAHPVDGHLMRLTFPEVLVGKTLVGYTGIDDFENRKKSKKPVMFQVTLGSNTLGTIRHESSWPWRRFTLDTSAHAGQKMPVRFEISAPQGSFARTFCFTAEMRR